MRATILTMLVMGAASLFSSKADARDWFLGQYTPRNPEFYVSHIDSNGSHVYAISGGSLFKITNCPWTWGACTYNYQGDAGPDHETVHLAVSSSGKLFRVNSAGVVQRWNPNLTTPQKWQNGAWSNNPCAKHLSVGTDSEMWMIQCSSWVGKIRRWNGAEWIEPQAGATAYEVTVPTPAIGAAQPVIIKAAGVIAKWNGANFVNWPGGTSCANWMMTSLGNPIWYKFSCTANDSYEWLGGKWEPYAQLSPSVTIIDVSQDGGWLVGEEGGFLRAYKYDTTAG